MSPQGIGPEGSDAPSTANNFQTHPQYLVKYASRERNGGANSARSNAVWVSDNSKACMA